jgi:hypothetical protein
MKASLDGLLAFALGVLAILASWAVTALLVHLWLW